MKPDDELCLCFHVTRRKIENFIRLTRPRVPSRVSECGGAGTGCGWCRPLLERLWKAAQEDRDADDLPDATSHQVGRTRFRAQTRGENAD